MTVKLSAYMLTCNNERTVRRALKSLAFADEIVVVDSGSTDGTLEIVREFAVRLEERPWPGFREQYQFAHEACTHPWVLFLDADEEIPPELAEEITRTLERADTDGSVGYSIPRRTFFIDRWILHGGWRSDREVRLCRRDQSEWRGGLHACLHVAGPVSPLTRPIQHYTYRDVADQLDTINRYSTTAAEDMAENGKRPSLLRMLFKPPARFLRDYLLRGGFLDGMPGFIIAVNTMFYLFNREAKLWEMQRHKRQ